ncbi:hypothetical protein CHS0354_014844 [Potamilus streckersoni]|uniref:Uncharacterized protein n=1 Tax=Potamilus streckersoni TaxID=2493646 RepID=A0AAE0VJX0_9BIVA|nr:hypothetical protein CHS0354_014844 [Potamilus streckersoni]
MANDTWRSDHYPINMEIQLKKKLESQKTTPKVTQRADQIFFKNTILRLQELGVNPIQVEIMWGPSQINLPENDKADMEAKLELEETNHSLRTQCSRKKHSIIKETKSAVATKPEKLY